MPSASPYADVWAALDGQVRAGRFPGYAAAIRRGDDTVVRVGGTLSVPDEGSGDAPSPMRPDTLFRIASLSKLVGGVLALGMVRDGVLGLDDPVATWLPELASPRVLSHPSAELHDTVGADRAIVVKDLLTFTFGLGLVLDDVPIAAAMRARGLSPGSDLSDVSDDEFMGRIGGLPLAYQPGERWLYHTGADVLGVLVARVAGRPLGDVLAERVTGPLGMASTGFYAQDVSRLATSYQPGPDGLLRAEEAEGAVASAPEFAALGAGLVSTVEDFMVFLDALSSRSDMVADETIRGLSTDSLNDAQRAGVQQLMGPGMSWGMGAGVDLEQARPWMRPGRFGWNGGSGTTACVDPGNDLAAVLLTQRMMTSPTGDFDDFWRAVYATV